LVPHDAVLDGSLPPPQAQLAAELAVPFRTPSGLVNTSDLDSTGTEQVSGASNTRSKPTGAPPVSAPKSQAPVAKQPPQSKKKAGKEEGAKEFTQRKLHEMKGLTPISKKPEVQSLSHGLEGTGEAEVAPSTTLPPPEPLPRQARQQEIQKQQRQPVPSWKSFIPPSAPLIRRPLAPALGLAAPGIATAPAATLQSPPSVVSKTWKGPSPTSAVNLAKNTHRTPAPMKPMPLAPRGIGLATSASRPSQAADLPAAAAAAAAAVEAGVREKATSPLPSFGQFAFNSRATKPSIVQHSTEIPISKDSNYMDRRRASSGDRSAPTPSAAAAVAVAAAVKDGDAGPGAAPPRKKQRIKLSNTSSSLNWLSNKFKTASANGKETTENIN
jgi:hypothetical protein